MSAIPPIPPQPIPPTSGKKNAHDYSFYWFKHGCCVPTTSVIWMMVVLFLFAIMVMMFCCLSMAFVRWIYVRQIRKKSDSLRHKYRSEEEKRKENEYRLKELALRPIHTTQIRNSPDQFHGEFAETPKQAAPEIPQSLAMRSSGSTGITPESSIQAPPKLFSGRTPLGSSQLAPGDVAYGDIPSGPYCALPVPPTAGAGAMDGTPADEVQMEPSDVAANVHTIAKEVKAEDRRLPFPGVVVVKKKPASECTSDIMVPITSMKDTTDQRSSTEYTSGTPGTGTRGTTGTAGTTLPYTSDHKQRPSGDKETIISLTEPVNDEERKKSQEHVRGIREIKPKPVPQIAKHEGPLDESPYSTPFFPYWTAQKFSSSKVESNISPSGKPRGTKITTSEKSFWMPTGTGYSASTPYSAALSSASSSQDAKATPQPHTKSAGSDVKERPRDVYELRRQLERMRANEISVGMQGVIEEARKRRKSEQALPLEITSKSAGPSSSQGQTEQLRSSPQEKKPPPFPALKAAAQAKGK